MPKKSIFDRYETYDPLVEGYGNPDQWRRVFNCVAGNSSSLEEARSVLGISSNTSLHDIKRIYRKLAFKYHPDKNNGEDTQFKKITRAYTQVVAQAPVKTTSVHIMPQLLSEIEEHELQRYLNSDDYCAQEKKDGRRRLIKVENNQVFGLNKKGKVVRTTSLIERGIRDIEFQECLLDGEEVGDIFWCFDILSLNGEDLSKKSYNDRWKINLTSANVKTVYTAYTTQDKEILYKKLKEEGKEGIVFKLLSGKHVAGYSYDQVKYKFYATTSVVVIRHNDRESIGVAVWDNGLKEIGNVTIRGHDRPAIGSIVEVKYLYCVNRLYQPSYLGIRDDCEVEDCTLSKLKFKST